MTLCYTRSRFSYTLSDLCSRPLQAKENVRKAAETKNPAECQRYLAEALRAFSRGARNLEFEKLREVIGDFQQLSYAQGRVYINTAVLY